MEGQAAENKYLESQGVPTSPPPPRPPQQHYPIGQSLPPPLPSQSYPPPELSSDAAAIQGPKKLIEAYLLGISLGFFGAHHFYLRRYGFGFVYLFTFGLLGVGYVVDLCRMPVLVKQANRRIQFPGTPQKKEIHEAYVLWMPMGLFGFHHFYLGRITWGLLYLFTFGLVGCGWLIDGFRMVSLVRHVNKKNQDVSEHKIPMFRNLCDVMVLTLNPITGLLGVQHYYLHRVGFGFFYTFTLGGLGIGWLIDIFRMPHLVKDINKRKIQGHDGSVRLDDCYTLAFPLGFLGLHHFYLSRPCWGVLYLLTFGCFGIGWLIDLFRLPCLVKEYNAKQGVRLTTVSGSQGNTIITTTTGPGTTVVVTTTQGAYPGAYTNQGYATGTVNTVPPTYPPNQAPNGAYPRQQVMTSYPPPPHQPNPNPQGYAQPPPQYQPQGMNYGAAGETSWSTINSSDFGDQPHFGEQPPAYEVSEGHIYPHLQNEANQRREAPSAPPADQKY